MNRAFWGGSDGKNGKNENDDRNVNDGSYGNDDKRGNDDKHYSHTSHSSHSARPTDDPQRPIIPPRGDYQTLLSYQKAEVVYDITFRFAHKFLSRGDRTIEQ